MWQTAEENASNFTADEVRWANVAKNLCRRIGSLSTRLLLSWIKKGLIKNCPIITKDLQRSILINEPNIVILRGKSKRIK